MSRPKYPGDLYMDLILAGAIAIALVLLASCTSAPTPAPDARPGEVSYLFCTEDGRQRVVTSPGAVPPQLIFEGEVWRRC